MKSMLAYDNGVASASGARGHTAVALLGYEAFCVLYRKIYVRYLAARTGSQAESERLADVTLGQIRQQWPRLLRSSNPAAQAWELVVAAGDLHPRRTGFPRRRLSRRQADAWVLSQQVGLPLSAVSAVMGQDLPTIASDLRVARSCVHDHR